MANRQLIEDALTAGDGIVRLAPAWVPRTMLIPGGRLKLDPRDLYPLGAHRGGIDERWLSSVTRADNGPLTAEDEGLSYIEFNGRKVLFKEAIETVGDMFLGVEVMARQGGWNMLCKFFDNLGPIPHHLHQTDEYAARVGRKSKPEAYYFPPEYNIQANNFPYTFMGLNPGTTKEDVRRCLERWNQGDNHILSLSRAYKLRPGTGWQLDAGILHAPGSLVTYEPQGNSDVLAMYQSMVEGRVVPRELLTKDVPREHHDDLDYLVGMIDWPANTDTHFIENRLFQPHPVRHPAEMSETGYSEKWVAYSTPNYSAKELTIFPGRSVRIHDSAAYGVVLTSGHGTFGKLEVETPLMLRYGQMSQDQLFVTAPAAANGIEIRNTSAAENLVMLKHFGPGNPDAPCEKVLRPVMLISLFITCYNDTLFPETGKAVVARARAARAHRRIPRSEQTCCGQMHYNTGYQREAIPLMRQLRRRLRRRRSDLHPVGLVRRHDPRALPEDGRRTGDRRWHERSRRAPAARLRVHGASRRQARA